MEKKRIFNKLIKEKTSTQSHQILAVFGVFYFGGALA